MKPAILTAILIIAIAGNMILGYQLYGYIHPETISSSGALNYSELNGTQAINVTSSSNSSFYFRYEFTVKLHLPHEGKYCIVINPTNFSSLVLLIYFQNGNTVSLSLNVTKAQISVDHKENKIKVYIYGRINQLPSLKKIISSLHLKFVYLGHDDHNSDRNNSKLSPPSLTTGKREKKRP
ncbi:hypothetical protein HS7_16010 [Sulfolobales archaeon HS-7]|nr:hypothetical protein HS7_16010 [Sulfolobales archaeon HS-7]